MTQVHVRQFGATPRKWHLIQWNEGQGWVALCTKTVMETMTDFPLSSAPRDKVCKHCQRKSGGLDEAHL